MSLNNLGNHLDLKTSGKDPGGEQGKQNIRLRA
jgi:hypothetical protein